jgi:hypothetical protein
MNQKQQLLTGATLALIALTSCTKGSGSSTTPSSSAPPLNATESSLAGRWIYVETHDTSFGYQDGVLILKTPTDRSTYTDANYLELMKTQDVNYGTQLPQAKAALDSKTDQSLPSYWYYDTPSKKLVLRGQYYDIISQTTNSLIVRCVYGNVSPSGSSVVLTYYSEFRR